MKNIIFHNSRLIFLSKSIEKIFFWRETIICRKTGMILVSHIHIKNTALEFATKGVLPQQSGGDYETDGS
jgi:hypothetical protein